MSGKQKPFASSVRQEAFCRHRLMADVYEYAERSELGAFEMLTHDVDLDGIDLTIAQDGLMVPLQLKSRILGASTKTWEVLRHVIMPRRSPVGTSPFLTRDQIIGPPLEGYGGFLVVQTIEWNERRERARLWYQATNLETIFYHSPRRLANLIKEARACPKKMVLKDGDLTPPMTPGELMWFLFGFPPYEEGSLVKHDDVHPSSWLTFTPREPNDEDEAEQQRAECHRKARVAYATFMNRARDRWKNRPGFRGD